MDSNFSLESEIRVYIILIFRLLALLDDHINITRPKSNKEIPTHERAFKCSPTTITPSNVAVNGSAKESVTAVDEGTLERPLANSK